MEPVGLPNLFQKLSGTSQMSPLVLRSFKEQVRYHPSLFQKLNGTSPKSLPFSQKFNGIKQERLRSSSWMETHKFIIKFYKNQSVMPQLDSLMSHKLSRLGLFSKFKKNEVRNASLVGSPEFLSCFK